MENLSYQPNIALIAACGLYCGACRKFVKGKCSGCLKNEKAGWCKIRQCCLEHQYASCADCTLVALDNCKKFNNMIGKIFSILFKSDRGACIRKLRAEGYEAFAKEMHKNRQQTIRK